MFHQASMFNSDVTNWTVIAITTREARFYTSSVSNGNVSSWDVAVVIDMGGLKILTCLWSMILMMIAMLLSVFFLNLEITPVLICWISMGRIKRSSFANISNNENNANINCCVTEDIVSDKIYCYLYIYWIKVLEVCRILEILILI